MANYWDTSIEYLKGVGPQKAELLKKELNIFTFWQLANYFPFRYVDRSQYFKIKELNDGLAHIQIIGKLQNIQQKGSGRGSRLTAELYDDTGVIELVWFKGIRWIRPTLKLDTPIVVYGKPSKFGQRLNITHPEVTLYEPASAIIGGNLQPVYSTTEKLTNKGLHSKGIEKIMRNLFHYADTIIPENLSNEIITDYALITQAEAYKNVHFPTSEQFSKKAIYRLKFDELFFAQLHILKNKDQRKKEIQGFIFSKVGANFNEFYTNKLPFELTQAQKRVIKEIRQDMGRGAQMNRLLQGDVGSGKTIVALLVMLLALDNNFQTCLMAPTEILANQHLESISEMIKGMEIKVALLTGSSKIAHRRILHEELENGTLQILIGTHALIEDKVKFKNLGLVVIDEQHRFGVAQRAKLWRKNTRPPHMLVMTATPIPRTLAMSFYGDLDVSVIEELPPGRKPIKTLHKFDSSRIQVFGFIKNEIEKGRQVYVVYPLIQESEALDYKDLMDGYESISRAFPLPKYKISIVHGQMKTAEKDAEMERFVKGETQIMVATTVIEVGVNVPNASMMVIESAERFGLSQLHQLRGRVGRGADQAYCVLMTGYKLSADGKTRMQTMVETNNGFEISEVDLKLRGPGDMMGTQQSGTLDLNIADLAKDGQILQLARDAVKTLIKNDSNFEQPDNRAIKFSFENYKKRNKNWSRIS